MLQGGVQFMRTCCRTSRRGQSRRPGLQAARSEVLYNRGLATAMSTAEAIAKAMEIHKKKEVTGAEVRDGLEALDIPGAVGGTGFEGMLAPLKITCATTRVRAEPRSSNGMPRTGDGGSSAASTSPTAR